MATVKKVKKAQNGAKKTVTEKSLRPQGIKNQYAESISKGKLDNIPAPKADTSARAKAIKEGKFREDPKTGDLFPVKKAGGKVMAKKAKSGAALKKAMSGYGGDMTPGTMMKMGGKSKKKMKMGGKCKYGC